MRFPWSSVLDRPKDVERNVQTTIPMTMSRQQPIIEIPVKGRQKRAQLHDSDSAQKHAPKRPRKGSLVKGDVAESKQQIQTLDKEPASTIKVVDRQNHVAGQAAAKLEKEISRSGPAKAHVTLPPPCPSQSGPQSTSSIAGRVSTDLN